MIQMHMQQGLLQDARIIRQEVFVEEQGFHHEFDEIDSRAWHLVLYENGQAAGCCRLFSSDQPEVYILGGWPCGSPAGAGSTGSGWYGKRKSGCAAAR